jgi:hypothetical protein
MFVRVSGPLFVILTKILPCGQVSGKRSFTARSAVVTPHEPPPGGGGCSVKVAVGCLAGGVDVGDGSAGGMVAAGSSVKVG